MECSYCGDPADTIDHIVSRKAVREVLRDLGGDALATWWGLETANDPSNLTPACRGCNSSKGAQPVDVWLLDAALGSPAVRPAVGEAIRSGRCAPWVLERVRNSARREIRGLFELRRLLAAVTS